MERFSTSPLANSASFETCQKVGLAAYASDTLAQTAASANATRTFLLDIGNSCSVYRLPSTVKTVDRRTWTVDRRPETVDLSCYRATASACESRSPSDRW